MAEGFNWFLILVAVVMSVLLLAACVYILIDYQHPEDRNQAWVPKIVVVLSMWLAVASVLMFPLDVANKRACSSDLSPSACTFTLPMLQLWYGVFIGGLVLAFVIIPFTLFFYEADSDFTCFQKVKSAGLWTMLFIVILALVIGIAYALAGYVVYPAQSLTSGVRDLDILTNITLVPTKCILPVTNLTANSTLPADLQCTAKASLAKLQCPANNQRCNEPKFVSQKWKLRVSLVVYIMAIQSVLGWVLFLIFAGVGVFSAPIDWLQQFLGRPRTTITKSVYMERARVIAIRAKQLVASIQQLKRSERDRKWRSNLNSVSREVALLEEDEYQLERVYPAGEGGDVRWVLFMLGFWVLLFMSIVGFCISLAWMAHILVYMLPPRPLTPMLNDLFLVLDGVFPLFGVMAFGFFCLYLMAVAMKGNFMLGLNFLVIKLYPMRPGATMMSSFLVNTALILLMAPAILQFCAQAFGVYASGTAIFDVFGNQVLYLMGIRYIYSFNIFLYILLGITGLSAIFMALRGKQIWKKRDPYDAYKNIT